MTTAPSTNSPHFHVRQDWLDRHREPILGASAAEKTELFAGTADRFYRLGLAAGTA